MTQLVEFENHKGEILRGFLDRQTRNKKGIIFVHGFEGSTIEPKFKNIIDLLRGKINLFRFDFSGYGISDGRFEDLTIKKLTQELETTIFLFSKTLPANKKIHILSNDKIPSQIKIIKISLGDHHLEKPSMRKQYINKLIKFIKK